jgi:hypothetical protein
MNAKGCPAQAVRRMRKTRFELFGEAMAWKQKKAAD